MSWLLITAFVVAGAALVVGVAGAVAKRRIAARYPPSGRLVDIGDHRLHVDCQGAGRPTVVLEAGVGDVGITWGAVQARVAQLTRVCAYDRAGLGWSDPSPRPRTAAAMVEELRELLRRADVPGPFVLVAQSFGALPASLFAATYPDEVAGLVLVDPAHEDQIARAPAAVQATYRRMARMVGPMFAVPRALAAAGIFALRPSMVPIMTGAAIPDAVGEARMRGLLARGSGTVRTLTDEMRRLEESRDQVRAARGSLGDRPVVVLSAGRDAPLPGGIPDEAQRENAALWRQLHAELAAQSSVGRVVVAEDSGHMIHHERPELVVEAVREVVEAVRGG